MKKVSLKQETPQFKLSYMENYTQIKNLIEKSENIFILTAREVEGDNLGGVLALFYTLKKLNKNVNLVLENIPEKFKFLPIPKYLNSLRMEKNFVISLDKMGDNVSEIHFDKEGEDLKISFFSKNGNLTEKDFTFTAQNLTPDLLISLAVQNLEGFGRFFKEEPQIFYEKPIFNIDNNPSNENFGELNLVEKDYSGISEIIADFLKEQYGNLIDENIATCLLTGVITATKNFQNQSTSYQNLALASYLIAKGALHQKIVQNLYNNQFAGSLKLLGGALAKLKFNREKEIYWASLDKNDFEQAKSSPKDLGGVLAGLKLLNPASFFILWESHNSAKAVKGILYTANQNWIKKIVNSYESTQKNKGVLFLVRDSDIIQAEKEVLNII